MIKLVLFVFMVGLCFGQDKADTTIETSLDATILVVPDTIQKKIKEAIPKDQESTENDTLVPLPKLRDIGKKAEKLPLGEPFFELKSSIELLHTNH
jgi:hypothetical protein